MVWLADVNLGVVGHFPETQASLPKSLDSLREAILVLHPVLLSNDRTRAGIAIRQGYGRDQQAQADDKQQPQSFVWNTHASCASSFGNFARALALQLPGILPVDDPSGTNWSHHPGFYVAVKNSI